MQGIVCEVMEDSLEQNRDWMIALKILLNFSHGLGWGRLPLQIFRVDQTPKERDIRAEGRFKVLIGLHQMSLIITLH